MKPASDIQVARIQVARDFALVAHGDQKYGDDPYMVHLDDVVAVLQEYGVSEPEILIAGYLHDVVEDTAVSLAEVQTKFGPVVADMVSFVTDEEGHNRKTRKLRSQQKRLKIIQDELFPPFVLESAVRVKMADRISNLRVSVVSGKKGHLKMYRKEHEAFYGSLIQSDVLDPMFQEYFKLLGIEAP